MRVQLITNELAGFHAYTGGVGVAFRSLAEELARLGDDVTVVTTRLGTSPVGRTLPPALPAWSSPVRVEAVDLPRPVLKLGPTAVAAALSRAALRLDADVMMAAEWGGWAAPLTHAARRPPLVTNLATSLAQIRAIEPSTGTRRQALRDREQMWLERHQTARSDAVVAISRSIRDWSYRLWQLDFRRMSVIPNFVPVEQLRHDAASAEPPWAGARQAPTVVFIGRVCRWKGADVLAAALPEIWAAEPATEVHFLGRVDQVDGVPMDQLVRRLAGERSGQVHFWGHRGRAETLAALTAADIAVFPSVYEGFGIAALEAKALGCAVVATRGSGFDDFCTDAQDCLLVEAGSVPELAAAVTRLFGSAELRAKLGAEASSSAEAYDTALIAPRFRELFADLAGRR